MALPENDTDKFVPKPFDEQTDRRIHEHLSNQFDEISEDDIRNIRTSIETGEAVLEDPENPITDSEDKVLKDDRNPETDNDSWEVLEP